MYLICKNVANEGPETIKDYMDAKQIAYEIIELHSAKTIANPSKYEGLIMLGGPMSVNDQLPYIEHEIEVARDFMLSGKKVFGICLGAQIMAKALGSRVYVGTKREVGWYNIKLSAEALKDFAMSALVWEGYTAKVFQWHGETFDLPEGAIRLASSDLYENQAFKYGSCCYAFQFHIEVKDQTIYEWLSSEQDVDLGIIKEQTERLYSEYHSRAMMFFDRFFNL